jgi:hypothetical protein
MGSDDGSANLDQLRRKRVAEELNKRDGDVDKVNAAFDRIESDTEKVDSTSSSERDRALQAGVKTIVAMLMSDPSRYPNFEAAESVIEGVAEQAAGSFGASIEETITMLERNNLVNETIKDLIDNHALHVQQHEKKDSDLKFNAALETIMESYQKLNLQIFKERLKLLCLDMGLEEDVFERSFYHLKQQESFRNSVLAEVAELIVNDKVREEFLTALETKDINYVAQMYERISDNGELKLLEALPHEITSSLAYLAQESFELFLRSQSDKDKDAVMIPDDLDSLYRQLTMVCYDNHGAPDREALQYFRQVWQESLLKTFQAWRTPYEDRGHLKSRELSLNWASVKDNLDRAVHGIDEDRYEEFKNKMHL